jgi:hypothetical protein
MIKLAPLYFGFLMDDAHKDLLSNLVIIAKLMPIWPESGRSQEIRSRVSYDHRGDKKSKLIIGLEAGY